MLQHLHIQDLAIIDSLDLEFGEGFTVLTGETGAGKSIIIGALNLVLGERASSDDVRSGCDAARVEATFRVSGNERIARALAEYQLAPDGESDDLPIRREVSAQGRSRCVINGVAAPLWQLRRIGDLLVDLHGQHQHQSLLRVELHREILDACGGAPVLRARANWRETFMRFREVTARLRRADRDAREAERHKGLLEYQLQEIRSAAPEPGEDAALEEERRRLEHAEALLEHTAGANEILYEGENVGATAADLLGRATDMLEAAATLDPSLGEAAARLAAQRAEIEDVCVILRDYASGLESDPARLQTVDDRLHTLGRLKKKYGATVGEVLEAADRFEKELGDLTLTTEDRGKLEKERLALEKELVRLAGELTDARRKAAERFSKDLRKELKQLEMPNVRFEVRIEPERIDAPVTDHAEEEEDGPPDDGPDFALETEPATKAPSSVAIPIAGAGLCRVHEHGADAVEFLISPNPGEELRPLRRIASGGELSRIMLALKVLLTGIEQVHTLVFDEIDTGISGRTGVRIGEKMVALGDDRQVVCITHLPQIAAQATTHYVVEKTEEKKRTLTRVRNVDGADREREIARLLGGEPDSELARSHARELLSPA